MGSRRTDTRIVLTGSCSRRDQRLLAESDEVSDPGPLAVGWTTTADM